MLSTKRMRKIQTLVNIYNLAQSPCDDLDYVISFKYLLLHLELLASAAKSMGINPKKLKDWLVQSFQGFVKNVRVVTDEDFRSMSEETIRELLALSEERCV